jgi:hypothetical protein
MRLSKLFLSSLIAMSAFSGLDAKPQKDSKPIKLYVDPSEVQVSQEGIALKTENGTLNIKTLRSDEDGLYVFEKDFSMAAKPCRPQAYKCPICRPSKYFCSSWALQAHMRKGKHSTLR